MTSDSVIGWRELDPLAYDWTTICNQILFKFY